MSITFIHCADVHLGSPLVASSEEKSALLNDAIENALKNMVNLAITQKVDFVVIAGDLFDGKITNATIGRKFLSIMKPLEENEIYSFVLFGNHDAQGKHDLSFSNKEYLKFFNSKEAETFIIEDKKIAVHGHSFEKQAVYENLSKNYPSKVDGFYNIGVLHTSLGSDSSGHDNYAPCSINDLSNKGYDYWALGHIHKREIIQESNPTIIYSGNIQGRHSKETGDKGCYLVQVDDNHKINYEFKKLNCVEFLDIEVDVENLNTMEEIKTKINDELPSVNTDIFLKLTLRGKTEQHYTINIEDIKLSLDSKIELVKLKNKSTYPKTQEQIAQEQNTVGNLMKCFENEQLKQDIEVIKKEVFDDVMKSFDDELKAEFDFDEILDIEEIVLEQLQKAHA